MTEPALDPRVAAATALFEKDVGTWDATVEIHPGPDMPPIPSRGTAVSRRIAGGRWLVTDFRNETGFEGHGLYGWDADKGKYVGTWVDDTRGFLAVAEGTWDAAARTMTFVTEATVGGRALRWREVTQALDPDTQVMRSLFPGPDGREIEVMKVTYKRRRL